MEDAAALRADRRWQGADLRAAGLTFKQVAEELGISVSTARALVKSTQDAVAIGGHAGLDVLRASEGIVKRVHGRNARGKELFDANVEGIANEARFLRLLSGTGTAPELLSVAPHHLVEEDVGALTLGQAIAAHTDDATTWWGLPLDGEEARRNAARMLWAFRQRDIINGDLTGVNIICPQGGRGSDLVAVDWQQSRLMGEPPPDARRHLSDAYLLWRTMASVPTQEHPTPDTPRVIRRWLAVLGDLGGVSSNEVLTGKTLLDLGCFQGDFCGLAAAAGMRATGVDLGGFNTGSDSIAVAHTLWPTDMPVRFAKADIVRWPSFKYDAVLLFSTWPYIIHTHGREVADDLLRRIIADCGTLYFETQLRGDGPGPDWFWQDDDVAGHLSQWANVTPLVTIPVTNRAASRTVWKVWKW